MACLRELFEEAGLLIACDDEGRAVHFSDAADIERLAAHRRAVNANELDFLTMMRQEGLLLDLRGLEYLAHWITPVGPPRRKAIARVQKPAPARPKARPSPARGPAKTIRNPYAGP